MLYFICGNIQRITGKFDDFQSFVTRVNTSHPISAICLQECWLDEKDTDSTKLFNLSDYTMVHQTKQCCGYGGLIIYIHNQFKYKLVDTIHQEATGWEYLCIELSHHEPTVGNTTVFHGRYSLFHTVGPDSLAELTCIFLVCDAYVANDI